MYNTKINWKDEVKRIETLSAEGKTLKEIGIIYGVSKQRIKQICAIYKIPTLGIKKRSIDKKIKWNKKWGNKEDTGLYHAQRAKYNGKRANAKAKNIEFTIDFGDIIWNKYCPYINIEIDYFTEGRQDNSCSFDRIDINKGYIKDNVIVCSWRANRIKNDGSVEEHRMIADYMEHLYNSRT